MHFQAGLESLNITDDGTSLLIGKRILVVQFRPAEISLKGTDPLNAKNGSVLHGQKDVVVLNHPMITASRKTPMTCLHTKEIADTESRRPYSWTLYVTPADS